MKHVQNKRRTAHSIQTEHSPHITSLRFCFALPVNAPNFVAIEILEWYDDREFGSITAATLEPSRFGQGATAHSFAFALALRVALCEFDQVTEKDGRFLASWLKYWAYVDSITVASAPETAPTAMTPLKRPGSMDRSGWRDTCTALATDNDMQRFVRRLRDGDLWVRKTNFTNSKTLVSRPTVTHVTFDLPESKEPIKIPFP